MDKGVDTQEVGRSQERTGMSIKKKAGLATGAAIVSAAAVFGGGGAPSVNAAGETQTPTGIPTGTSTPDAGATRVAEINLTTTAIQNETEANRKLTEAEKKLAAAQATATQQVILQTPTETATATQSPTPSKTPLSGPDATATADAPRREALGKRQAEIIATATADANATATKEAEQAGKQAIAEVQAMKTAVAKGELTPKSTGGGGVPGWLKAIGDITILGGLAYGGYRLYRRLRP